MKWCLLQSLLKIAKLKDVPENYENKAVLHARSKTGTCAKWKLLHADNHERKTTHTMSPMWFMPRSYECRPMEASRLWSVISWMFLSHNSFLPRSSTCNKQHSHYRDHMWDCYQNQIKSNHFYCHITTAQVPWWVKFLGACSRQCKKTTTNNLHMDRQCKKTTNNLHMDRQCKKTTTTIYIWTDSAKKQQTIYIWTDSAKKQQQQFTYGQTVQKKQQQQFTYGQTVQKNNKQFTYGQTVQKNNNNNLHMDRQCKKTTTTIYIWTDSAKKTTTTISLHLLQISFL